ncbi:hypothetical protein HDU84_009219 [Entophlyctis sp. JEL0112]|nr:hypothetical protein HDU84_009219 [Entophlyctis sp. JEL0112]
MAVRDFLLGLTGLGIASFACLHLGGHMIAPVAGPEAANSFLFAARELYRSPVVETALLAGICIHASLGVSKVIKRKVASMSSFTLAGLVLAVTVPLHTILARVLPAAVNTSIDLRFVRMSLSPTTNVGRVFLVLFLITMGSGGLYHGIMGIRPALRAVLGSGYKLSVIGQFSKQSRNAIAAASLAVMTITILSIAGHIGRDDPTFAYVDPNTEAIWRKLVVF